MLIRFFRSRQWRRFLATAAAAGLLGTGFVAASPAGADTTLAQHVYNTSGEGLWLHPDSTSLTSTLSDLMADGTEFDVTCWVTGDDVNGDSVWDFGTNTATGSTGYAADYYIDTNTTQGSEGDQLTAQGVPQCGTSISDSSSGSQDSTNDGAGTESDSTPVMDLSTPCSGSVWVQGLQVEPFPGGNFKIIVTPTPELRDPIHSVDRDITVDIWHDIQSCVPGLYGGLADSIWQQLQCHQEFAVASFATGPTFDFESWHPALPNPGVGTYVSSHCLNKLGTDPGTPTGDPMTPGEGYLDLSPIA